MEDKGSYFLVNVLQGGSQWKFMRKGRITASNLGKIVGVASYCNLPDEELAEILVGNKKEKFDQKAIKRMQKGTDYEDHVRKYLEKELNVKITETGFAILKSNPNFGASLDGVIDDDTGIEIKCPQYMYKPILEYMNNPDRDENDTSHIWKSQMCQIIMGAAITGRKYMVFCVYSWGDKKFFYQKIKVDYDYWDNFLYPKACDFFEKHMKPLLDEKKKIKN